LDFKLIINLNTTALAVLITGLITVPIVVLIAILVIVFAIVLVLVVTLIPKTLLASFGKYLEGNISVIQVCDNVHHPIRHFIFLPDALHRNCPSLEYAVGRKRPSMTIWFSFFKNLPSLLALFQ